MIVLKQSHVKYRLRVSIGGIGDETSFSASKDMLVYSCVMALQLKNDGRYTSTKTTKEVKGMLCGENLERTRNHI